MADSTINDVSKMKVVDLRKELKSRGLSYAGDKAELVARLQSAMAHDEHGDITLDSDEIDSDGVLEDEDDKSQNDILDDTGVDALHEELALADQSPSKQANGESKPLKTLKRKLQDDNKEKLDDKTENKEAGSKKIVLNRNISMTSTTTKTTENVSEDAPASDTPTSNNKIKITADVDPKTRLEMRAKRFGLPVKMSDAERKEARKNRFGDSATTTVTSSSTLSTLSTAPGTLASNLEKLKKRAERFGQSVSAIMTDIENKEKLEKRKAKFGTVK